MFANQRLCKSENSTSLCSLKISIETSYDTVKNHINLGLVIKFSINQFFKLGNSKEEWRISRGKEISSILENGTHSPHSHLDFLIWYQMGYIILERSKEELKRFWQYNAQYLIIIFPTILISVLFVNWSTALMYYSVSFLQARWTFRRRRFRLNLATSWGYKLVFMPKLLCPPIINSLIYNYPLTIHSLFGINQKDYSVQFLYTHFLIFLHDFRG